MAEIRDAMSQTAARFREGGSIAASSGTVLANRFRSHWSLFRRTIWPQRRRVSVYGNDIVTDRDKAVSLAKVVLQKQKLGISLTSTQSLLMSRELLSAIRE